VRAAVPETTAEIIPFPLARTRRNAGEQAERAWTKRPDQRGPRIEWGSHYHDAAIAEEQRPRS
jgi:hypothetical protein